MKVAPFDENAFKMDHPRGTVSFNYILMGGEPEKLENFRYILGRQEADFHMPRHRHSFELAGTAQLQRPFALHAVRVGHHDAQPAVRIDQIELLDASSNRFGLAAVKHGEGVVGNGRGRDTQQR